MDVGSVTSFVVSVKLSVVPDSASLRANLKMGNGKQTSWKVYNYNRAASHNI